MNRVPTATWSSETDRWETGESIFGHSDVFSETLPKWGMTRSGELFELPMPELATAGSGCSSSPRMLPTPTATYSGNSPELHLSKKPGRTQVTDLRILVEGVGLT